MSTVSATSVHSTFSSLFISLIISTYLTSSFNQTGYYVIKSAREGILWRVFACILCILGTSSVAFASFTVFEILLEQQMMKWPFAIILSELILSSILIQIYFIHKLQTTINGDILANTVSALLVFFLLVQIGVGTIVVINLMKLPVITEIFGINLSWTDQGNLAMILMIWLGCSLASDFIAFVSLVFYELKFENREIEETRFDVFCRVCQKTNLVSTAYSLTHFIMFTLFYRSGIPFSLFIAKTQVEIVSMFLTMKTQRMGRIGSLDTQLTQSKHLSSLSSLFKGTDFRSDSREGHIEPFVVEMDTDSIIVATPTSSRWNSTIPTRRPNDLSVRRIAIADELSLSDYGQSSGIDITTPKIFSEGLFSIQQQLPARVSPRYFVH